MKVIHSASWSAAPNPPTGIGNLRTALPSKGSASCASSNGVMTAPGASAFNRMPAPAQSRVTECRRTHRLTAILDAAYISAEPRSPSRRRLRTALSGSWASSALIVRRGTSGTVLAELLAITTTFARSAAASAGRHAVSGSTTPRKFTWAMSRLRSPPDPGPRPAASTAPSSTPPADANTASAAARRPCGSDRSAMTSASLRSTPMTRWPSARSRRAVCNPMPEADPVIA